MDTDLIKYILPSGILEHFKVTGLSESIDEETTVIVLQIDLEEINNIPQGYNSNEYESKGFYPVILIKDFPLRDRAVVLAIKRRRWRNKSNKNEVIHNDYSFIATGAKLTQELSDFLKDTD